MLKFAFAYLGRRRLACATLVILLGLLPVCTVPNVDTVSGAAAQQVDGTGYTHLRASKPAKFGCVLPNAIACNCGCPRAVLSCGKDYFADPIVTKCAAQYSASECFIPIVACRWGLAESAASLSDSCSPVTVPLGAGADTVTLSVTDAAGQKSCAFESVDVTGIWHFGPVMTAKLDGTSADTDLPVLVIDPAATCSSTIAEWMYTRPLEVQRAPISKVMLETAKATLCHPIEPSILTDYSSKIGAEFQLIQLNRPPSTGASLNILVDSRSSTVNAATVHLTIDTPGGQQDIDLESPQIAGKQWYIGQIQFGGCYGSGMIRYCDAVGGWHWSEAAATAGHECLVF